MISLLSTIFMWHSYAQMDYLGNPTTFPVKLATVSLAEKLAHPGLTAVEQVEERFTIVDGELIVTHVGTGTIDFVWAPELVLDEEQVLPEVAYGIENPIRVIRPLHTYERPALTLVA